MKPILTILLLFCVPLHNYAQKDSVVQPVNNNIGISDSPKINFTNDSLKNKDGNRQSQFISNRQINVDSFETNLDLNTNILDSSSPNNILADTSYFATSIEQIKILKWGEDSAFSKLLKTSISKKFVSEELKAGNARSIKRNDALFYVLVALVLYAGFIKQAFPKYFRNLFHQIFQPSIRQKQTDEQLTQGGLPSLMLNLFFVLTGGLFIALVAMQYGWINIPYWWLALDCTVILATAYLLKYAVITFTGWVFNSREAATSYKFIVFLINKIIGFILLPLLILLSFSGEEVKDIIITSTACIVSLLLLYRYAISVTMIRRQLKVSALHFFIYLCAVEIMPMLIIYKLLFTQNGELINF